MLERMWSKRNTSPLLVGMQIGTTTMESSMANSQKIGNHSSSRPSHTTPGHITKECPVIPQGHMLNYVHSSIICNTRTWKQPRCPSTEEWIRKMWFIYTMEYYAAEKNNDIMKFAGKWMELENVILRSVNYEESFFYIKQLGNLMDFHQSCGKYGHCIFPKVSFIKHRSLSGKKEVEIDVKANMNFKIHELAFDL
ncbi:hypothetical protein STEG23_005405 [Scotinomys teguina]